MNSVESEKFRSWLISNQKLQMRSAGDLISRRNKLLSFIAEPTNLNLEVIKSQLEDLSTTEHFSRSTLTAMIRAEKLYRKFKLELMNP